MPGTQTTWGGSLHQTFRLLPTPTKNLKVFLESNGRTESEVLQNLPYDAARARGGGNGTPDPKRYRDGRQIYQEAGLLYESALGHVKVTDLGNATLRWLALINDKNAPILGRHAAYALAACQLRNPTGAGRKYAGTVEVFPYSFIWRAMLALGNKINSDELNRAIFRVTCEDELHLAISKIKKARAENEIDLLGNETLTETRKNDRIIAWMSVASFGWTLIADKRSGGGDDAGYYKIFPSTLSIVAEAARIRHRHRDFASEEDYIEWVSRAAALPKDLREPTT